MSFNIIGTGSCIPKQILNNDDLCKIVDTSKEWIETRTGIFTRHIIGKEDIISLASKASLDALKMANVKPVELDLIIGTTQLGKFICPSNACLIQKEIKAICPAFDINVGCSGFIYALNIAKAYFDSNMAKKILIVSAEQLSKVTDYTNRKTCVLFGDGAGAVVLEKGDNLKSIKLYAKGDESILNIPHNFGNFPLINKDINKVACSQEKALECSQEKALECSQEKALECSQEKALDININILPYIFMNGQEVYKFAVKAVPKDIKEVCKMANISVENLNFIFLHQANLRIINTAKSILNVKNEVMKTNIETCGNTATACIPMMLDDAMKKGELSGKIIALAAFGGGLTSGACIIKFN